MQESALDVLAGSSVVIAGTLIFIAFRLDGIWYELMTWTSTLGQGQMPKR